MFYKDRPQIEANASQSYKTCPLPLVPKVESNDDLPTFRFLPPSPWNNYGPLWLLNPCLHSSIVPSYLPNAVGAFSLDCHFLFWNKKNLLWPLHTSLSLSLPLSLIGDSKMQNQIRAKTFVIASDWSLYLLHTTTCYYILHYYLHLPATTYYTTTCTYLGRPFKRFNAAAFKTVWYIWHVKR